MFRPIANHAATTLNIVRAPAATQTRALLNGLVTRRLLHTLRFMSQEQRPLSGSQAPHLQQKRNKTSLRVLNALSKVPARIVEENFRFQKPDQSDANIRTLQTKLLSAMSDHPQASPCFDTKVNPTADDIEALVEEYGPVRLTLYGLLPAGEGATALPSAHTVLVIGTCDHDGTNYAIVVDGNDLARNPIKAVADSYAQSRGKALHELDENDYQNINRELITNDLTPAFAQTMYRVIDLNRVIENHEATTTKYENYLDNMREDLEKEGMVAPLHESIIKPATAVYDRDSKIGGKLQHDQRDALTTLIRTSPEIVEPLIPLQGPGASSDPFVQVPGIEAVFNARSNAAPWTPPANVEELKDSLKHEPTFRAALDQPENRQWAEDLFNALAAKEMPKGERGIEMIMRFRCTYGTVHHLAIGTLWRDKEGALQTGIHHQEAIPINRKEWEGHVYSTFDTAKDCPGGHAPVAESIKLAGMPDLKLLTTRYPDKIIGIANAMSGPEHAYPYGPNEAWSKSKWRFPVDRPFITCSNTTLDAHDIMRGQYPIHKHTLPDLFKTRIGELNNTDYNKVKMIKVGDTDYDMDDIMKFPPEIAGSMFAAAGMMWGNHRPWDVNSPRDVKSGRVPLSVGEAIPLPKDQLPKEYHGASFINPKALKTHTGEPVERNVFYPRAEIDRMTYSADKPGKLIFVAAVERQLK